MEFAQDENVIVHNLGDGKEYRAKIAGISSDFPTGKIMIVQMIDSFRDDDYKFSHCCITEHCLKKESEKIQNIPCTITDYLKEKNKDLAVICKFDKNGNEYDHVFFLVEKDDENITETAFDLEIMKMLDVSIWKPTISEIKTLGLTDIRNCFNYKK